MKYITADFDIPYYNMALEEYIMNSDEFDDEYLFFYIHRPSVIIGKYQSAMSEVNMKYIDENNVFLARRISGGGAVYHDEGNLNFSFICKKTEAGINFEPYVRPVINALEKLGLECSLSGRNDLLLDKKKFGGNAQHIGKDKVLSHGTIMVDVDIENMTKALNVDPEKYITKGISSVRSRVINLNERLAEKMSAKKMREYLAEEFIRTMDCGIYELTAGDMAEVEELVKNKFSSWQHNFGGRAAFGTTKKKKLPAGLIEISYEAKGGVISEISISGDYFADGDIAVTENALSGTALRREDIISSLEGNNVISGLSCEELADLILYE